MFRNIDNDYTLSGNTTHITMVGTCVTKAANSPGLNALPLQALPSIGSLSLSNKVCLSLMLYLYLIRSVFI